MAQRTIKSHGQFILPHLRSTDTVLDAGCGPGSMTQGLAQTVEEGHVYGIDSSASQIERSIANATKAGISNVTFQVGSCYELPFNNESFDCVFSHALLEHLSRPLDVLREFTRILKPGGIIGICSPDSDGWILAPPSHELTNATAAYVALQDSNGGNLRVGKYLSTYLQRTGFTEIVTAARYECYDSLEFIGQYLALQLDKADLADYAACFREWTQSEVGLFAQTWIWATGKKI